MRNFASKNPIHPMHTPRKLLFLASILALALLSACTDEALIYETVIHHDEELYALERTALQRMNVGGTITVVGHKSQDPDAVCSSIAMAALMRELGMDAVACMQEKPIQGVKYIFDALGYPLPEVRTSIAPGAPLVLMDHNDPMQSLDGMMLANVVGIVDHHPVSAAFSSPLPIYYNCMNVGSSCTIVHSIYKECGITPTRDIAQIMLAGILADTDSLSKATCTAADSLAFSSLAKTAEMANIQAFTSGLRMAQDSFDGLTDEEIFLSDIKGYTIGGVTLAVASLDANESMHIDEMCRRMRAVMPAIQKQLGVEMVFAKMEEKFLHPETPDANGAPTTSYVTHIPYYGEGAREVAEAAFGPTTHDNCVVLQRKVSRKTDFIPAITQVLERQ